MKPAPNRYYHFGPFLPDGSGERQHMMITEADLYKQPFGRHSKRSTVFDAITRRHYTVQLERSDHHLVAPEADHG
jgi:hypothetical protein